MNSSLESLKIRSSYQLDYTPGEDIQITHDGQYMVLKQVDDGGDYLIFIDVCTFNEAFRLKEDFDEESIAAYTISPVNEIVVVSTRNLLLRMWNWRDKIVIMTWKSYHTQPVVAMALSADARYLATGAADSVVRIWRLRTAVADGTTASAANSQALVYSCRDHTGQISLLRFHPATHFLVTGASATVDCGLRVWRLHVPSSTEGHPQSTATAPLGSLAARLRGHTSRVTGVDFAAVVTRGGHVTMATCGHDSLVLVWRLQVSATAGAAADTVSPLLRIATGEQTLEACLFLATPQLINASLQPTGADDHYVVTVGSDGVLRVWRLSAARCVLELTRREVAGVTAGGGAAGTGSSSPHGPRSGQSLVRARLTGGGQLSGGDLPADPQADGNLDCLMLVRASGAVEFYREASLQLHTEMVCDVGEVCVTALLPDRTLVVASSGASLRLFPLALPPPQEENGEREGDTPIPLATSARDSSWCSSGFQVADDADACVTDMQVSPCGGLIAVADTSNAIRVVRCTPGSIEQDPARNGIRVGPRHHLHLVAECRGHVTRVTTLTFDRLGRTVYAAAAAGSKTATGGTAGVAVSLKAWQLPRRVTEVTGVTENSAPAVTEVTSVCSVTAPHGKQINRLLVGHDNRLLVSASRDKTVNIWDILTTGLTLRKAFKGHKKAVWDVDISSDDQLCVSGSSDTNVILWRILDLSTVWTFEGHECPVYRVMFSADNQTLISCDHNGQLKLWGVKSRACRDTYASAGEQQQERLWAACKTADDGVVVAGSEAGRLTVWTNSTTDDRLEREAKQIKLIEDNQRISNLVASGRDAEALQLAIEADQPKRCHDIISKLLITPDDAGSQEEAQTPPPPAGLSVAFDRAMSGLGEAEQRALLAMAVRWNAAARSYWPAQAVLHWLLRRHPPRRLLAWPGAAAAIRAMAPHTERHHANLGRLAASLTGFVGYVRRRISLLPTAVDGGE